jgi:replication factor C small subunit
MEIMNREHTLLVEKYRSKTLNEYVGNEHIKSTIKKYLEQNDIQNFLFYGGAGCGKTTLAKLIVNNLDCDYLYINSSDERGIDTIRDKVSGFASTASFKPLKVVILDEADFITIQGQAALRNVIETYSRTTRFILTCNYIERIIDPIQSRCQVLKIEPPSKKDIAKHLAKILDTENILYTVGDIKTIVNHYYPDLRKMLNTLQLSTYESEIRLDPSILVSSNYIVAVIEELKQTKPDWKVIRQIIANSGVNDFEELFRHLYDNASVYAPNREGSVAIYINEHAYQANFRIDKEINVMSLISKLIDIK